MNLRVKVFTVPGQVVHSSTRRLVLQGADGIVFVADSQLAET
jgi:signal recognition particle receptor subunit beta